ncbi:ABC transporter C family protein [Dictyostelium discoideum AX4]|uniref:ABC transporter C family member 5 n=1 Tax=Dictyostelium discoideum TaxID=44689 RepID=ABCC5_DICDI|nr:ABC transporter C family protein [Dictyostelium discoideum AX4]Q54LE6.1 RecName: Full=ABC transporter C family member 5; AltName: Full=ABC transporter ABCC.5 [Dictyostelium discoideum]EAL64035.1 ABC transporter C family protein [Dictyostelium discoideum AX4]|eukprot:XP_637615.1 ABC transporter C family protein [Dictyostelium discoideum AX4]
MKYNNLENDDSDIHNNNNNNESEGDSLIELEEINLEGNNNNDINNNNNINNNNDSLDYENNKGSKKKNNKKYVILNEEEDINDKKVENGENETSSFTYGHDNEFKDLPLPKKGFGGLKSLEENANFLSSMTYLWADKFVLYCFKNILQLDEIWELASYDKSSYLFDIMDKNWQNELKNSKKPNFMKAAFKSFGKHFALSWVHFGLNVISQFIGPIFLKKIVSFVIQYRENPGSVDPNLGYYYALILFVNSMLGSIFLYQSNMITSRTGNRLKSLIVLYVYKKSLKLTNSSRSKKSNGEIVNLMSNDAQRLLELFQMVNTLIFAVPMIIVSMILLYDCVGWPSFVALLVMGISLPYSLNRGSQLSIYRRKLVGFTDQRIKVVNEMFQAIKTIKLYAWEDYFSQKMMSKRGEEIKFLTQFVRFRYSLIVVVQSIPTIISIFMFTVYYLVNSKLPADKIFAAVAYLNIIRVPFTFLPYGYNIYIQFKVSIERVVNFLNMDEINQGDDKNNEINVNVCDQQKQQQTDIGIYMDNTTFSWAIKPQTNPPPPRTTPSNDKSSPSGNNSNNEKKEVQVSFSLKNTSCQVKEKGSLLMVIGPVGSGKSSFCQALLGEMELENNGSLRVVGSIAYVSQSAWIMNASLKDNILFGKEYNKERYEMVLNCCALLPDLALFPQGDLIEIGERGINLSGGQKQRVAIARAVYSDSDIYILDDILSAVDAHVGKHLFYNCIKGILKEKIVVLATNQLNYCPYSTQTLILKTGGEVEQYDTFENIISTINSAYGNSSLFSELLKQYAHMAGDSDKDSDEIVDDEMIKSKENNNDLYDGKLTTIEEREEGSVSFKHYMYYVTAGGGFLFLIALLGYCIDTSTSTFTNWWLSNWSSKHTSTGINNNNSSSSNSISSSSSYIIDSLSSLNINEDGDIENAGEFLGVFIAIGVLTVLLIIVRTIVFFEYSIRATTEIHKRLFWSILRAPMWFFDTVPLGRILNRFTRDTDIVDMLLTNSLNQFLNFSTNCIAILVIISIATPWLLLPMTPIIILFYFIQYFYRRTSIQIQRIESITRSPIFSHFAETLNGVITLRAFRKMGENVLKNQALLDDNNKCYLTLQAMNQWLGLRLSVLGNLITLLSCIFITVDRSSIAIASVGLSISYTLSLTTNLNKATQQLAELETKMNSIERISYYTENVPQEPDQIIESNRPPMGWPSLTNSNHTPPIIFENVVMSYRQGLPAVLKGISFEIKAGEKIGICGRTGSGKSSLLLALFRIVELSSGRIIIDGLDISKIGLKDLRSQLAIIPQEPVMFTGTLRSNLDSLSEHTDSELWDVLKEIQLYEHVKKVSVADEGLDLRVNDNWSQGQKQLIGLGRALLKKPKILVCDEATASVDSLSDELIQRIIREKFKDAIILTIAHRLNTIVESDRIMVLDSGSIVEFNKPSILAQNENSLFNWLIDETGTQNSQYLRSLIKH